MTGGSAHDVVLMGGPQPPQAPPEYSPGLRNAQQKHVRPVQDLQCCVLQLEQAKAEGWRDKSDVAGRAGKGNEADVVCAQEQGRRHLSLSSALQPTGLRIPQGLGAAQGQETACCGFIYIQNQTINVHADRGLGCGKSLETVPAAQPQPRRKEV